MTDRESPNAGCGPLAPEGNVLMHRSFVRLSIFESTLADLSDAPENFPTMTLTAALGLPVTELLKRKMSLDATTGPHAVAKEKDVSIPMGPDLVYTPGVEDQPRFMKLSSVNEAMLEIPKTLEKHLGVALSEGEIRSLRTNRFLDLKSGPEKTQNRIVLRPAANRAAPLRIPRRKILFSSAGTDFGDEGGASAEIFLNSIVSLWFNGDEAAAIEAFLADLRAERFGYFNPAFAPHERLSELTDTEYDAIFPLLLNLPAWSTVVSIAPTPEWPQYRIGVATIYRQKYSLEGYQRGRLVESITLGPDESLTSEVFVWDRTVHTRTEIRETGVETDTEGSWKTGINNQFSNQVEQMLSVGVSGNLGGSLPLESVATTLSLSISPNVKSSIESGAEATVEQINEATRKASENVKQRFEVRTVTTRELGRESRQTRTFKNPNRGRALHLHHFEVLANYEVATTVDEKPQIVLEVQNSPLPAFDADWIRAHHAMLIDELPHPAFLEGLQAAQVVAGRRWFLRFAAEERQAQDTYRAELKAAHTEEPEGSPPPGAIEGSKVSIYATADRMYDTLKHALDLGGFNGPVAVIAEWKLGGGVSPYQLQKAEKTLAQVAWWNAFATAYPSFQPSAKAFVDKYRQTGLRDKSVLTLAEKNDVVSQLGLLVQSLDDDWLMAVKSVGTGALIAAVSNALLAFMPGNLLLGPIVIPYTMKLLVAPDDMGLSKLISQARLEHRQFGAYQTAKELGATRQAIPDSGATTPVVPAPPRVYTDQELADANAALSRLQLHLDANRVHYTNVYYRREDPALRLDRLRSIGVADFVENRILGFAGTKAIYPLRVSSLSKKTGDELKNLIPDYASLDVEAPFSIQIPTSGIVTETLQGECEALEPYLVRLRELELEEREIRLSGLRRDLELQNAGGESPSDG